jgi:hypothetical protein
MKRNDLLAVLGAVVLSAGPALAADKVEIDEGGTVKKEADSGRGMRKASPPVRAILAAHPNQLVVVCVAGCGGKPRPVQILPKATTGRVGGHVPTAAHGDGKVYGPPVPAAVERARTRDDVVCLAGCRGKPGQVLQHVSGLPPPRKPMSVKEREEKLRKARE